MDRVVDLKVPARSARATPSLRAFLELAFRPLYLAGTAWALIAIVIWIYAPQLLTGPLQGIAWHAHEMLWGFVATIAVAFMLTAGATWTGINPLKGGALGMVCTLWLFARVGFLAGNALFWVAVAAELGFFLLAAVAMMRAVYRARNTRNYAVPWLLVGLGGTDAMYLLVAVRGGDYALLMQHFNAGLLAMALIALLIARRVIPFFAMSAINGLKIPLQTRTGQVQLAACAAAMIFLLARLQAPTAVALGVAGALSLLQVATWKPYAVRGNPLLWILYAGHAGLGIGLLLAACVIAGINLPPALPVHTIAMAGFSVLIIGMVTRTALGHLGQPLVADRSVLASYVLILLAVASRLAAIPTSAFSVLALQLSAAAWIAALALYLWRFTPLMIRPRD